MPISKQYFKTKPECKVTFTIPAKEAETVILTGDFNDWDEEQYPLKKLKNGTFKGTVNLPKDKTFQFKYIVDGTWINDGEADGYQWNDFAASENGILVL